MAAARRTDRAVSSWRRNKRREEQSVRSQAVAGFAYCFLSVGVRDRAFALALGPLLGRTPAHPRIRPRSYAEVDTAVCFDDQDLVAQNVGRQFEDRACNLVDRAIEVGFAVVGMDRDLQA